MFKISFLGFTFGGHLVGVVIAALLTLIYLDEPRTRSRSNSFPLISCQLQATRQRHASQSQVPLHLLGVPHSSLSHVRYTSSSTSNQSADHALFSHTPVETSSQPAVTNEPEQQPTESVSWEASTTPSGSLQPSSTPVEYVAQTTTSSEAQQQLAESSFFGFQSLAGLFGVKESRPRYSRPDEVLLRMKDETHPAELENEAKVDADAQPRASDELRAWEVSTTGDWTVRPTTLAGDRSQDGKDGDQARVDSLDGAARSYRRLNLRERSGSKTASSNVVAPVTTEQGNDGGGKTPLWRRLMPSSPSIRGRVEVKPGSGRSRIPSRQALANPFTKTLEPHRNQLNQAVREPAEPWGISPMDLAGNEAFEESQSATSIGDKSGVQHATEDSRSPANVDGKTDMRSMETPSTNTSKPSGPSTQLSHVKSSGEAHMVNVGAKAATKRVAIATGSVLFSNREPLRLIREDSNKKGDVLSVARIAGIMASKRASDLIPLCHPVAIDHVEVELSLRPPTKPSRSGHIHIQALVSCTGRTGVEMEALTAATSAAMTVYDMCKAVDRDMRLFGLSVPYKSGGKSGLHFNEKWAHNRGLDFFLERGLEMPEGWVKQWRKDNDIQKVGEAGVRADEDASKRHEPTRKPGTIEVTDSVNRRNRMKRMNRKMRERPT